MPRERPFSQFNFTVSWDGLEQAGFQEVSGLGLEITVAEYRAGNEVENAPLRKITGTYKVPDVTFKRGVGAYEDIYLWLEQVRGGQQEEALKAVTIELLSEDRTPVQRWVLHNARPIKYTGPALNGKGTDVAIEELVLAAERATQEFV